MNKTRSLLLGATLTLFLGSCFVSRSRSNEHIDPELVAQLVPGQTTAQEVVELLGAPMDVVQLAYRSAYRYDYIQSKQAGLFLLVLMVRGVDIKNDRVWVFFDEDEVLTHVGQTFESDQASYEVPVFSSEE